MSELKTLPGRTSSNVMTSQIHSFIVIRLTIKAPEYKHNLILPDYIEMARILSTINGQFILSINDRPEMREIFKAFKIQPVSLLYSVGTKPTKAKELIIMN